MSEKNFKRGRDASLHLGHRERMRKRFSDTDGVGMSDHELLEMLLFHSIPRSDTNETAHRLIDAFGSLQGVINAPQKALVCIDGVGASSALLIRLVSTLMNRYSVSEMKSRRLRVRRADDAVPYLKQLLFAKAHEEMYMLTFRETGMLIGYHLISDTKDATSLHVDIRKCLHTALAEAATFVIIAHNHTNGALTPSAQDLRLTRHLDEQFSSMGITLAEHILIANDKHLCIKAYMEQRDY